MVIHAAKSHFARFGYNKASLEMIGSTAGVNKATLYYYFKSKEDLYVQVIEAESDTLVAHLHEQTSGLTLPNDKITQLLTSRIGFYQLNENLHQLSINSLATLEPLFDELYEKVKQKELDVLTWLLDEGANQGDYRKMDMLPIAEGLLLLSDALRLEAVRKANDLRSKEIDYQTATIKTRDLSHVILNGIS